MIPMVDPSRRPPPQALPPEVMQQAIEMMKEERRRQMVQKLMWQLKRRRTPLGIEVPGKPEPLWMQKYPETNPGQIELKLTREMLGI